jgi:O-antigen/teichoic acid export membrane protein
MSSQAVTWTLTAVTLAIVPRYLGNESVGILAIAGTYTFLAVTIASFGTERLVTIEVARRPATLTSLVRRVNTLRLAFYAVLAPLVLLALWLGPYVPATLDNGYIIVATGVFTLLATTSTAGLHGLQEMGRTAAIDVLVKLGATVFTIGVLLAGGGMTSVVIVRLGVAVGSVVLLRYALRSVAAGRAATAANYAGRALVAVSAPFFLAEVARISYQQIDVIVMSMLVDERFIGIYTVADNLFGTLLFLPVIVTTALFPAIAQLHERAPDEVGPMLRRSFGTLMLVAVPVGFGTVAVAKSFAPLLFGEEFRQSGPVLAVYGIVVVASSQTVLLGQFAIATGRVRFWSYLLIGATLLTIPLDLVLVPLMDRWYGNPAIAGALAYVVTEGLMAGIGIWKVGTDLLSRTTAIRTAKCLVAGGAMLAASWPWRDSFFVVPGVISVVTYVVVILLLRTLSQEEWGYVRRARWAIQARFAS